ncbi:MAG TPA: sialidase family protein [Solirubrobacteraceae bacterium]|jgi:hypothetical protein
MPKQVKSGQMARPTLILASAALTAAIGMGIPTASGQATTAVAASLLSPTPTLTATPIGRVPSTLKPGSDVHSRDLGHRVFVDDRHGFALANIGQAQYPAASTNGGRTWRVSGPALHLNAAQAPFVVCEVGALNRRVYFADGCGGEVVDSTSDGGKHWWRTLFGGGVQAVVGSGGRLVAFVAVSSEGGPTAVTWVYASNDGGKHWHYESQL